MTHTSTLILMKTLEAHARNFNTTSTHTTSTQQHVMTHTLAKHTIENVNEVVQHTTYDTHPTHVTTWYTLYPS
jgi:hypothetical protein